MKDKFKLFVEYLWLAIAGFSFIGAIKEAYLSHWKDSAIFLVMIIVSILMYIFRKKIRKSTESTS